MEKEIFEGEYIIDNKLIKTSKDKINKGDYMVVIPIKGEPYIAIYLHSIQYDEFIKHYYHNCVKNEVNVDFDDGSINGLTNVNISYLKIIEANDIRYSSGI